MGSIVERLVNKIIGANPQLKILKISAPDKPFPTHF
jgi:hypothetical protein